MFIQIRSKRKNDYDCARNTACIEERLDVIGQLRSTHTRTESNNLLSYLLGLLERIHQPNYNNHNILQSSPFELPEIALV